MATRREIDIKRTTMHDALRAACAEGRLAPGEMLPPMRELAEQYGVSVKVAWKAVQTLIDEGVLHTVSRMGTFVGKPQGQFDVYLMTVPHVPGSDEYFYQLQMGFEERVAQLGGVSLRLTEAEARQHLMDGDLPPLAGIFCSGTRSSDEMWWPESVPSVEFGQVKETQGWTDKIRFDDIAGGRQAARHLLSMGHQKIGFLGLHTADNQLARFYWSAEREKGWRETMTAAGRSCHRLAFHPEAEAAARLQGNLMGPEQEEAAFLLAAEQLIPRRDITAVIAANVHAANGLLRALDVAKIPASEWPAMLCFDDVPSGNRSVVSYLRLSWDEVGRAAAQSLWERKTGLLSGPPQQRLVPMRLIPRLTCRPDWAASVLGRSQTLNRALNPVPTLSVQEPAVA